MKKENQKCLYFAYGANMNPRIMQTLCPESSFLTVAYYPNHTLQFTKCPKSSKWGKGSWVADMVFSREGNNKVWGVVYQILSASLEVLDENEGVKYRTGYKRRTVFVRSKKDGSFLNPWTYFVKQKKGPGKPSKLYMDTILEGAYKYELPLKYISFLESIETI